MSSRVEGKGGDAFDWIFDVVLQILEGEGFDCAVMDFIDEHCEIFDSIDEENKLKFTQIHRLFVDHIEALIMSSCADLVLFSSLLYSFASAFLLFTARVLSVRESLRSSSMKRAR